HGLRLAVLFVGEVGDASPLTAVPEAANPAPVTEPDPHLLEVLFPGVEPLLAGGSVENAVGLRAVREQLEDQLHADVADGASVAVLGDHGPDEGLDLRLEAGREPLTSQELPPGQPAVTKLRVVSPPLTRGQ